MMVVFDAAEFRSLYAPDFPEEKVSDEKLTWFFQTACSKIGNDDGSLLPYDPDKGVYDRKQALYMFVCHLASMSLLGADQLGPAQSAAEGSVSVSFAKLSGQLSTKWLGQTQCGQALWSLYLRPLALGGRIADAPDFHPYG